MEQRNSFINKNIKFSFEFRPVSRNRHKWNKENCTKQRKINAHKKRPIKSNHDGSCEKNEIQERMDLMSLAFFQSICSITAPLSLIQR